jgi:putative transposase
MSWPGWEKKLVWTTDQKRSAIEVGEPRLSIRRQCDLLGLSRGSWSYTPRGENEENLQLMHLLDEQYTRTPFYGVLRMTAWLQRQGYAVNEKRVRRLLRSMGLMAIYPSPKTSLPAPSHRIYPYLLRGEAITRPDFVWSTDITYIRLAHGFVYLVAIMDWYSRYVLAWRLSNSLETHFCVEALEHALAGTAPEIFNSDQGAQFTSVEFTRRLDQRGVRISMDGRGRALDNAFVERLWRSVKWEEVYVHSYQSVSDAWHGLNRYFVSYNQERPHQALGYRTPAEVHTQHT